MAKRSPKKRHETRRILNCLPSPKQEQDWQLDHAEAAGVAAAAAPVPASKDLRASWWPINDQGSTGSCVGWATADSMLRWHYAQNGAIAKSDLLSPRYVWMAAKETDEFSTRPTTFIESDGTSLKAALDVARRYGVVRETVLPFLSSKLYRGDEPTFYTLAAQLRVTAYFNLGRSLTNWKLWLATQGPILTRLGVDSTWDDAAATDGKLDVYRPETNRGGHAVALVGYTSDRFIVRNSWGEGWGDDGFGHASSAYAQAAFTESYGVMV
ncbi:MAG: hypothetical protein QOF68_2707 [Gaiellales bacterium]|nr:hypothetical protein [Gaiellales bacterium]